MKWMIRRCIPPEMTLSQRDWWRLEYHLIRGGLNRFTPAENRRFFVFWMAVMVSLAPILFIGDRLNPGLNEAVLSVTCFISWIALASWGFVRVSHPAYQRMVSAALREMGHDVCSRCGHWLRGFEDDPLRCPECGTEQSTSGGNRG